MTASADPHASDPASRGRSKVPLMAVFAAFFAAFAFLSMRSLLKPGRVLPEWNTIIPYFPPHHPGMEQTRLSYTMGAMDTMVAGGVFVWSVLCLVLFAVFIVRALRKA